MILSDQRILDEMENGTIKIEPYDRNCLGSNSYDVHLGKHLALYVSIAACVLSPYYPTAYSQSKQVAAAQLRPLMVRQERAVLWSKPPKNQKELLLCLRPNWLCLQVVASKGQKTGEWLKI